ncbi:unnamed protein product, partial [Musa acuminata var. zebrina]
YTLPRCIACETVLAPFLLWHRREEKDLDREGGEGESDAQKARWWEGWLERKDKTSLGFGPVAIHFFLPPFSLPLLLSSSPTFFRERERERERGASACRTVAHIDPMMLGEEEDVSSECSSGCQSGWTAYLDQSSYDSPQPLVYNKAGYLQEEEEEEEEEDLSMVSDASSGPPHFHEEDEPSFCYLHSSTCFEGGGCLCSALTPAAGSAKSGAKRKRVEPEQQREHSSLLDDTASSTLLSYPKASSIPHPCSQSYFRPTCSLALYRLNSNNYLKPPMEGVLEFSCGFSATHFKWYDLEQRNHELHKQVGYLQSSSPVKPTPTSPVKRSP